MSSLEENGNNPLPLLYESLSLNRRKEPVQAKSGVFDESVVTAAANSVIEPFISRPEYSRGFERGTVCDVQK